MNPATDRLHPFVTRQVPRHFLLCGYFGWYPIDGSTESENPASYPPIYSVLFHHAPITLSPCLGFIKNPTGAYMFFIVAHVATSLLLTARYGKWHNRNGGISPRTQPKQLSFGDWIRPKTDRRHAGCWNENSTTSLLKVYNGGYLVMWPPPPFARPLLCTTYRLRNVLQMTACDG